MPLVGSISLHLHFRHWRFLNSTLAAIVWFMNRMYFVISSKIFKLSFGENNTIGIWNIHLRRYSINSHNTVYIYYYRCGLLSWTIEQLVFMTWLIITFVCSWSELLSTKFCIEGINFALHKQSIKTEDSWINIMFFFQAKISLEIWSLHLTRLLIDYIELFYNSVEWTKKSLFSEHYIDFIKFSRIAFKTWHCDHVIVKNNNVIWSRLTMCKSRSCYLIDLYEIAICR